MKLLKAIKRSSCLTYLSKLAHSYLLESLLRLHLEHETDSHEKERTRAAIITFGYDFGKEPLFINLSNVHGFALKFSLYE